MGLGAAVVVAAVMIATPLVLMARSQTDRTEQAVGALEGAEGVAAEVSLNLAVQVASAYFAERGSFSGFTPQVAASREPGIRWSAAPRAVAGEISVRAVRGDSLVLVTADGTGTPACAAIRGTVTTFGAQDASSPDACVP